jgi:tRNA(Ile)-lysidine synthase
VLEQVVKSITRYSMLAPGQRAGVAVSGGADSVALLHALHRLAPENGWTLVVLHLDHCLRGAESDGDARFVAELAARLGWPALIERQMVSEAGGNLEEEARHARYAFFRESKKRERLDRIALGHTLSDQAETVLFRLLRGAGTTGLSGIWPATEEGVVRPLIEVSRDEVIRYLREQGQEWREDSSNRDLRFRRNRLRRQLLPELRQQWNPELDAGLGRLAALCQDEERYWQAEVKRLLEESATVSGDALILDAARLAPLADAAVRRVLRSAVARVRKDSQNVEYRHIEQLVELLRRGEGTGRAALPGVEAWRSFGWLRLEAGRKRVRGYRVALPVPGEAPLPAGGRLRTELERGAVDCRYNTSGEAVDWERVSGTLELRSWLPGDTFRPSGRAHEYKIKDLFQRARVPCWDRQNWPMVSMGPSVVWVRGFGVAEGFEASASTRTRLRLHELSEDSGAA